MEKVTDLRPVKRRLRTESKAFRKALNPEWKARADRKIQNRLLNLWLLREAKTVLTYVSTPIEVDTRYLIRTLLSRGKRVAVPKCENDRGEMSFYLIRSLSDLDTGFFGVSEPIPEKTEKLTDFQDSVCIVPAFLFDEQGFRLGYGKGYYDRFLSGFPGKTIGICYDVNIVAKLLHGKYDRPVNLLVSEKRIRPVEESESTACAAEKESQNG